MHSMLWYDLRSEVRRGAACCARRPARSRPPRLVSSAGTRRMRSRPKRNTSPRRRNRSARSSVLTDASMQEPCAARVHRMGAAVRARIPASPTAVRQRARLAGAAAKQAIRSVVPIRCWVSIAARQARCAVAPPLMAVVSAPHKTRVAHRTASSAVSGTWGAARPMVEPARTDGRRSRQ